MRDIDFRPNWYCATRQRKRDAIIRASLLSILALELGLGLLTVSARKANAQHQIADLRGVLENQARVFEHLGEEVVDLNELKLKQRLLSDVAGGAPVHAILAEMSRLLPESLVFTSVSYKQQRRIGIAPTKGGSPPAKPDAPHTEKANTLKIAGLAASDRDIGALMSRMAASALFTDVTLVYSRPVLQGTLTAREFKLALGVPQFE